MHTTESDSAVWCTPWSLTLWWDTHCTSFWEILFSLLRAVLWTQQLSGMMHNAELTPQWNIHLAWSWILKIRISRQIGTEFLKLLSLFIISTSFWEILFSLLRAVLWTPQLSGMMHNAEPTEGRIMNKMEAENLCETVPWNSLNIFEARM